MKITVLVENNVPLSVGLTGEHGLSFLIENEGEKVLFDTGQGMSLLNNLQRLGHKPEEVKKVVLSHGHYDHTGGVKALLAAGVSFELIAHPGVFSEKLALFPGAGFRPIGMPSSRAELESHGVTLRLESAAAEIAPGITATGEIPVRNDFEKIEPVLFVREGGSEIPDPLADDQALILNSGKGAVVLLGCAHRGVVNTLRHVAEITGGAPVRAVIGGFHLERAPEDQIQKTAAALKTLDPQTIRTAHCTGLPALFALKRELGDRVSPCGVGMTFEF
ncbi:MAG TPA: MBL fold metallo-hydrolase [bacterium]|nr:MBL fold metallo-hydrolase [bacterium]